MEDELKAKGISDVLVFCVNDGAVMKAWAADQGIEDSYVTFLGDPRSELTKALDLVLDHPGPMSVLGNNRCKRFSMLIDDGVIKTVNVAASEDDPAVDDKPDVTLAQKMLQDL
jgi:peroxiredoxin